MAFPSGHRPLAACQGIVVRRLELATTRRAGFGPGNDRDMLRRRKTCKINLLDGNTQQQSVNGLIGWESLDNRAALAGVTGAGWSHWLDVRRGRIKLMDVA